MVDLTHYPSPVLATRGDLALVGVAALVIGIILGAQAHAWQARQDAKLLANCKTCHVYKTAIVYDSAADTEAPAHAKIAARNNVRRLR